MLGRQGVRDRRPADRPEIHVRPLIAINLAILAFGLLIDRVGLAITAAVLTVGAAYARRDVDLMETLLLAAASRCSRSPSSSTG